MLKPMLYVAAALLLTGVAVKASEQKMASAMFCNTADEMKEVITANNPDSQADTVNERNGESSCTSMRVIYDAVEDGETVAAKTGLWTIMKVHVVGAMPFPGMMLPFDADQYAARHVPGQGT